MTKDEQFAYNEGVNSHREVTLFIRRTYFFAGASISFLAGAVTTAAIFALVTLLR